MIFVFDLSFGVGLCPSIQMYSALIFVMGAILLVRPSGFCHGCSGQSDMIAFDSPA
jgi:hypothetical protein